MRRRDLILSMSAAALAVACQRQQEKSETPNASSDDAAAPGGRATIDPATVVRTFYDRYLTQGATFPELRDQAPWSVSLWTELQAMNARSEARNEPILDFDPFISAQDYQLSDVNVVTESMVENSHATVRASFNNLGRRDEVVYDLIWESDRWRVDNIRGSDWDLRQIAAS